MNIFITQPSYTHLKMFGCQCFPLLRHYNSNKLAPKSISCIFTGYTHSRKAIFAMNQSQEKPTLLVTLYSTNIIFHSNHTLSLPINSLHPHTLHLHSYPQQQLHLLTRTHSPPHNSTPTSPLNIFNHTTQLP